MRAQAHLNKHLDVIPHKKTLERAQVHFNPKAKDAPDALRRALPSLLKYMEKKGAVERWRPVEVTSERVIIEALLVVV